MSRAFSLVELSIVLVILGLLTGGILAGQSLIRASELRAIPTEYNKWVTASQSFRDKYFAVPGDMINATKFWGDDNTNCADAAIPNGTPGTCNGNGNGQVEWAAGAAVTGETMQYWKHLSLAGLIEGTYTGISTGCYFCGDRGTTWPASKFPQGGWVTAQLGTVAAGNPQWFEGSYGQVYYFGRNTSGGYTSDTVMKPEEAWNIDTKMDDGQPARGKVRTWNHTFHTNCTDTDALTATYTLTYSSNACALVLDT